MQPRRNEVSNDVYNLYLDLSLRAIFRLIWCYIRPSIYYLNVEVQVEISRSKSIYLPKLQHTEQDLVPLQNHIKALFYIHCFGRFRTYVHSSGVFSTYYLVTSNVASLSCLSVPCVIRQRTIRVHAKYRVISRRLIFLIAIHRALKKHWI
jgi:hypothetical protein